MNAYLKIRARFRRKKVASQAETCIQYTDFISFGVLCTDWGKIEKGVCNA